LDPTVVLFSLAGQFVETAGGGSTGPLVFNTNNLASGVYGVSLEMRLDGFSGVVSQVFTKVALVH